MADERIALVIESQARLEGIRAAKAGITDVGNAASQMSDKAAAASAAQERAIRGVGQSLADRRIETDKANAAAKAGEQARLAALAAERAEINESLSLIAAKARVTNVANAAELAEIRAIIMAEQEHIQRIGGTEKQYLRLQATLQGLENRVQSYGRSTAAAHNQAARLNSVTGSMPIEKIRTAGNSVSMIAQSAANATLSGQGAAVAFGNLAQTLVLVGNAGRFAAMASGIGAVVVVATSLISVFQKLTGEVEVSAERMKELNKLDLGESISEVERLRRKVTELDAVPWWERIKPGLLRGGPIQAVIDLISGTREQQSAAADIRALQDRIAEKAKRMAEQNRSLLEQGNRDLFQGEQAVALARLELAIGKDQLTTLAEQHSLKQLQADQSFAAREREIRAQYMMVRQEDELDEHVARRMAKGRQLIAQAREQLDVTQALNEAERLAAENQQRRAEAQYRLDTGAMRGDPSLSYEIEKANIEEQYRRDIEDKRISMAAAEERRILRLKKLEEDRVSAIVSGLGRSANAMRGYSKNAANAFQSVADAIEKYQILKQGKADAQLAISEGAAALKSLGNWDFRGAALHAASSAQYAAAAAAAGAQVFGGSPGGSSGGGGGPDDRSPTFEPGGRGAAGTGALTLNFITRHDDGRETVRRVVYELERGQRLDRPIPLNATTGIAVFSE